MDVQDWWSGGELVALELSGTEQGVFVRREGSGPSMTLLHGFPSSSHDWARIAPALAERYALTMPDLLGFGASTKPREHRYSLLEQADLVEALWVREGIESTAVVAHDYSVSVAQELLTRRATGALAVDLRALHSMNGGIYPDLHRPQPAQVALLDAPRTTRDSSRRSSAAPAPGLVPTFPEGYDSDADADGIWQSFHLRNGQERERRALDAGTPDDRRTLTFIGECSTRSPVRTWLSASVSGSRMPRLQRWRTLRIGLRSRRRSAWSPRYCASSALSLSRHAVASRCVYSGATVQDVSRKGRLKREHGVADLAPLAAEIRHAAELEEDAVDAVSTVGAPSRSTADEARRAVEPKGDAPDAASTAAAPSRSASRGRKRQAVGARVARVAVDDETWAAFRDLCGSTPASIRLGELVAGEVERSRKPATDVDVTTAVQAIRSQIDELEALVRRAAPPA